MALVTTLVALGCAPESPDPLAACLDRCSREHWPDLRQQCEDACSEGWEHE
jgi:hypothetical protein